MSKSRKSLATTKGKDTSRRAKPLVAGALMKKRIVLNDYDGKVIIRVRK